MRVIRRGVFETASSSVHSVSIDGRPQKDWPKNRWTSRSGWVRVEGGEFGWGPEEHNDPQTKASYAWTYLLETGQTGGTLRQWLEEVIKEHTGCDVDLIEPRRHKGGWMEDCYIDHASLREHGDQEPCPGEEIFESKKTLAAFIFGNSTLVIDNDNY